MGILLQTPLLTVYVTLAWLKDLIDLLADYNHWTKLMDFSGNSSSVAGAETGPSVCRSSLSQGVGHRIRALTLDSFSVVWTSLFPEERWQRELLTCSWNPQKPQDKMQTDMLCRKLALLLELDLTWNLKAYRKHRLIHPSWGSWRESLSPFHVVRYDCSFFSS